MSALSVIRHAATRLEVIGDSLRGEREQQCRDVAGRLRAARDALEQLVMAASQVARNAGLSDIHRDDPDLARLAACLRGLGGVA